jgi:hypothetical protein
MKYNIPGRRQWLTISVLTALAVPLMAPETMAQSTAETAAKNPVSAVAIMYHRFGEDAHPSTNIKLEQFDAHLAELSSGKYAVLPLPEIVAALRSGTPLPDRAVAITIDDAYRSVYTEAWPRLRKAGLPFTLFVATQPVEQGLPGFMTWDQIRELRDAGVTIGAHTHTHAHLAKGSLAAAKAEIDTSTVILKRELSHGTGPHRGPQFRLRPAFRRHGTGPIALLSATLCAERNLWRDGPADACPERIAGAGNRHRPDQPADRAVRQPTGFRVHRR